MNDVSRCKLFGINQISKPDTSLILSKSMGIIIHTTRKNSSNIKIKIPEGKYTFSEISFSVSMLLLLKN